MTIKEYILDRLGSWGLIKASDSLLLDILEKSNLVEDRKANSYSVKERELALLSFIPELLLSLDSISENGFSVSRSNTEDRIKTYYSFKCKEYDIEDVLNKPSSISDGSNLW